jgi:hypothetical protein
MLALRLLSPSRLFFGQTMRRHAAFQMCCAHSDYHAQECILIDFNPMKTRRHSIWAVHFSPDISVKRFRAVTDGPID